VKFDSMDEHRIATRHRVLKAGTIEFGGGAIDCTVRNISATGAALDVTSPLGIPAQFTLVTDGNRLPCRIIWRKEKRIGVTFDQNSNAIRSSNAIKSRNRMFRALTREFDNAGVAVTGRHLRIRAGCESADSGGLKSPTSNPAHRDRPKT
jgi:PilZ domain